MSRPEPAGVGTAEEIAAQIIVRWSAHWMHGVMWSEREPLIAAIASAITASRRQAKEEAAKIAELRITGDPKCEQAVRVAAAGIAAAIRKTIE